jgi:hypothetical protein
LLHQKVGVTLQNKKKTKAYTTSEGVVFTIGIALEEGAVLDGA